VARVPGAAGHAAEGVIAKLVKRFVRSAERDAVRAGARDAARAGARDAARAGGRDAARGAGRRSVRDRVRDAGRSLWHRVTRADPVDVVTGDVVLHQVDVELPGLLPLLLSRTHVSSYRDGGWFGPSWASTVDQRLELTATGITYFADDGAQLFYPREGGAVATLPLAGARLPLGLAATGYQVGLPELGRTLHFGLPGAAPAAVLPLVAMTDRSGQRIDLGYGEQGELREVRHSGGYRIAVRAEDGLVRALTLVGADTELVRFGYDGRRLTEVVNASGLPLRFSYDADGRLTGWQDRLGTSYRYTYDEDGRCVAAAGTGGFLSAAFEHRPDERATVVTDSLGQPSRYEYNDLGQVVRETDPLGASTLSEWDAGDRLLARTDPLGRTTRYDYDAAGNRTATTGPDGAVITAGYNAARQPVWLLDADGARWEWAYDAAGNLVAATDPGGGTTGYGYDGRNHLASVTDPLGNTHLVGSDDAGLPVRVTDPLGDTTRYERDAFGRIAAVADPLGNTTRWGFTVAGTPAWRVLPDGASDRWEYDAEGNLTVHIGPLGAVTRTEYGLFDLPAARITPDGARLEFRYDTELRLVQVTDPYGRSWDYGYDPAGRLVSESDVDGRATVHRYDRAGQPVERTDAGGRTMRWSYDAAGSVVEQVAGDAVSTFEYDLAGRVRRATRAGVEVSYERDAAGRVVLERCDDRVVESAYDPAGRRLLRRTPSGVDSHWEWDAAGRPALLRAAGQTLRFGYDRAGREVSRQLGAARLVQTWDVGSQLRGQAVTAADGTVRQQRTYTYRGDGALTGLTDRLGGPREYGLDLLGRVTTVDGPQWREQYGYDIAGAVTWADWPGAGDAGGPRLMDGSRVRQAGGVHYEHDPQGRVTRRRHRTLSGGWREWRYEWDDEDQLTAVATPDGQRWEYRYDPFGRRTAKTLVDAGGAVRAEVRFSWDGSRLAEQTGAGGTVSWDWQPDSFRPLTQLHRGGDGAAARAVLTDPAGTPTDLVTPEGTVSWHAAGTLWGVGAPPAGGEWCPLRFPGQYHDLETGESYSYFRYYDPRTAAFTAPDPFGLSGGFHPYAYVPNPLGWTDPLGLTAYPAQRPGGHVTHDVAPHRNLSPGANRAPGHGNIPADGRVQSHHIVQDAWGRRNGIPGYSRGRAPAVLLPTTGGPHAAISAAQAARRAAVGWRTPIRDEFHASAAQMRAAGVPESVVRKSIKDAYRYFSDLGVL
jgi:RHS repeat-associated protein